MIAGSEQQACAVEGDGAIEGAEIKQGSPGHPVLVVGRRFPEDADTGGRVHPVGADKGKGAGAARGAALLVGGDRNAARVAHGVEGVHPEHDVDSGKAPAGTEQHLGQVGPVHHRIGRAKPLAHRGAQRQRSERPAGAERVKVDALGLKAPGGQLALEAELVEHSPGIGADLQPRAHFLHGPVALEHDHRRAELGQGQGERQPGNAGAGNVDGSAATGHG